MALQDSFAAAALVAGGLTAGQAAADTAEAVALVPVIDAAGIGQEVALFVLDIGADLAEILEDARSAQKFVLVGVLDMADIQGEVGGALDQCRAAPARPQSLRRDLDVADFEDRGFDEIRTL